MTKKNDPKSLQGLRYEVPPGGSLGLLALGYRGLEAWREAQKKFRDAEKLSENGKKKS